MKTYQWLALVVALMLRSARSSTEPVDQTGLAMDEIVSSSKIPHPYRERNPGHL